MPTLAERLDALTAALVAAPPPAGGPAHRIASDYSSGSGKSGGRHVASKAGAKRYGLPIGTPLDGTHSKKKQDKATKASYDTFMAASTPADQRKSASWLSTADLKRAGEALFSFDSKNERDQSARIALVKELADRGIDPHSIGYKGGPVVLNPNPKPDPVERAAATKKKKAEQDRTQKANAATRAAKAKDTATKQAAKDATTAAQQQARQALAKAIVEGTITEAEARRQMRHALTAGFLDRGFLSRKAKAQLRDKNGRWIEMGAEVLVDTPDGGRTAGRIVDVGDADGWVTYQDADTGEEARAFHNSVEKISAILPGEDIALEDAEPSSPSVDFPWEAATPQVQAPVPQAPAAPKMVFRDSNGPGKARQRINPDGSMAWDGPGSVVGDMPVEQASQMAQFAEDRGWDYRTSQSGLERLRGQVHVEVAVPPGETLTLSPPLT